MKRLFTHTRLYIILSIVAAIFLLSYWFTALYSIAWILVVGLVVVLVIELLILFRIKKGVIAKRSLPLKLSNSDKNEIFILVENRYPFKISAKIIEELPLQFQKRDFEYNLSLDEGEKQNIKYNLRPVERGEYYFGKMHIFISSPLKILIRRYSFHEDKNMVKVYPSYIQMKKYEFLALNNQHYDHGLKKIRRLGHTMEFEHIKKYVPGDDIRTINWKTTAKYAKLMVNQYQDEKSQPVYSLIDTGRVMKMPFEGLKLLDYAINSTLAFSNIVLLKKDKIGLVEFGKKIEHFLPASNVKTRLNVINETLYNIDTKFIDSDFSYLYAFIKRKISQRSLLILYTNFEHKSSLKKQMIYLKALAKKHLVVTVIFENTELDSLINKQAEDLQGIYHKTIAEKFAYDKRLIVKELHLNGIHAILTKPENLTVNVINKYLELKARGRL